MPRRGPHFSSEELAQVLSHYDIGVIDDITPLSGSSKRAAKLVVASQQGKFLLKRRTKGKTNLERVNFAHAVQNQLNTENFPVTKLIATRDENDTVLQLDNRIYEFFKFVTGSRYDGTADATVETGRQLGKLHKYLADFTCETRTLRGCFHDSSIVRRHLKTVGSKKNSGNNRKLQKTVEALMELYNNSSVHVNELGFDQWPEQVVHGDWHPGNMLFYKGKLNAVVDFDSVKIAPTVTDLANGMLQFSIVGNRPNPVDWPAYLDQAKLIQFLSGYREVIELDDNQLESLLDLMIETIIAEAVLPIATTGFFGNLSGADFLMMIHRKADWLNQNRQKLNEAIKHHPPHHPPQKEKICH